jgi:hypothetical protein
MNSSDGNQLTAECTAGYVAFLTTGDVSKDPATGGLKFAPPAKDWKPWSPVMAAVGEY